MRIGGWWIALVAGCSFSGSGGTGTDGDPGRADAPLTDGPARDANGDAPIDGRAADARPPDAALPDAGPSSILIEAEAPTMSMSLSDGYNWVVETAIGGFTGTGYVSALPNTGSQCGTWSPSCGCVNHYQFTVTAFATYQITTRFASPDSSSDSAFWNIDTDAVTLETFSPDDDSFHDDVSATSVLLTPGPHVFHLWLRENGQRIDHIRLDPQ